MFWVLNGSCNHVNFIPSFILSEELWPKYLKQSDFLKILRLHFIFSDDVNNMTSFIFNSMKEL